MGGSLGCDIDETERQRRVLLHGSFRLRAMDWKGLVGKSRAIRSKHWMPGAKSPPAAEIDHKIVLGAQQDRT